MTIIERGVSDMIFQTRDNESKRWEYTSGAPNSNTNLQRNENSENFSMMMMLTIPLLVLVLVNLLANGTILAIFLKTKCIRRCRNIYILSLTLADLFSGITMPTSIFGVLMGDGWNMEPIVNLIFVVVRYSLLFTSLLSILLLTVDRWWSINYPFSYRVKRSRKISVLIVATCWVLSFVFHIPILVSQSSGYEHNGTNLITFSTVLYSYNHEHNLIFSVCISVVENLFPVVSLLSLTVAIHVKLFKRRNTTKLRRSMSLTEKYMIRKGFIESNNSSVTSNDIDDSGRHSFLLHQQRKYSPYKLFKPGTITVMLDNPNGRRRSPDTSNYIYGMKTKLFDKGAFKQFLSRKQSDDIVKDFLVRQDKKAILSLGLLAITAFACRLPYIISTLTYTISGNSIPTWITISSYLGLVANSSINPFLYGFGNSDFRKILKAWISCTNEQKYRMQSSLLYCQLIQNGELKPVQEFSS